MIETRTVEIQYFAILRQERGVKSETYSTGAGTLAELYEELRVAHRFTLPLESLKVAVNDRFADWHSGFARGDRVIFLPPVAGG